MFTSLIIGIINPTYNYPVIANTKIKCSDTGCFDTYNRPEFISESEIAHQFSNKMSKQVGDKLKDLYKNRKYSKVDFNNIRMSTKNMETGEVIYKLHTPFITVEKKYDSFTSFDHVGGWNHIPTLAAKKIQLNNLVIKGE